MVTICFTYFKNLTLAHLEAALYTVSRQDLSHVEEIVIVDNDSPDPPDLILAAIDSVHLPITVRFLPLKHGDATRTHAWSTNVAVREAQTPWIFFTRADFLLDFDLLRRLTDVAGARSADWDGFVTANTYHLHVSLQTCDRLDWRQQGTSVLRSFAGAVADYTIVDAGVWLARRSAFDRVGGLDERLNEWGHSQTLFQHRLHETGTEFVRIPEELYFHPRHDGPRNIEVAHKQLGDLGIDIRTLWERSDTVHPYGRRA